MSWQRIYFLYSPMPLIYSFLSFCRKVTRLYCRQQNTNRRHDIVGIVYKTIVLARLWKKFLGVWHANAKKNVFTWYFSQQRKTAQPHASLFIAFMSMFSNPDATNINWRGHKKKNLFPICQRREPQCYVERLSRLPRLLGPTNKLSSFYFIYYYTIQRYQSQPNKFICDMEIFLNWAWGTATFRSQILMTSYYQTS